MSGLQRSGWGQIGAQERRRTIAIRSSAGVTAVALVAPNPLWLTVALALVGVSQAV